MRSVMSAEETVEGHIFPHSKRSQLLHSPIQSVRGDPRSLRKTHISHRGGAAGKPELFACPFTGLIYRRGTCQQGAGYTCRRLRCAVSGETPRSAFAGQPEGDLRYRDYPRTGNLGAEAYRSLFLHLRGLRRDIVARGFRADKGDGDPNAVDIELPAGRKVDRELCSRLGLQAGRPSASSDRSTTWPWNSGLESRANHAPAPSSCMLMVGGGPQRHR